MELAHVSTGPNNSPTLPDEQLLFIKSGGVALNLLLTGPMLN
jgi:hypothetical protein